MFENLFTNSGLSLERLKTFREIVAAGGITAAAGLIKGILGTLLVIGANKLARKAGQEGLFSAS